MSNNDSPYSLASTLDFINQNFGIIFLSILFLIVGFFAGSIWTDSRISKAGGTNNPAAQAPTEQQPPQAALSTEVLAQLASDQGVAADTYETCIQNPEIAQRVQDQMTGGEAAGIGGTPGTIVVVDGEPKEVISGALPYPQVKAVLDRYLTGTGEPDPQSAALLIADGFVPVSEADHIRGNAEASVVLVEYSDYECPYCRSFHPSMVQAMEEYGDQVAWVYRHFPLGFHATAMPSAIAAECVADEAGNDAFWAFSDAAFSI